MRTQYYSPYDYTVGHPYDLYNSNGYTLHADGQYARFGRRRQRADVDLYQTRWGEPVRGGIFDDRRW